MNYPINYQKIITQSAAKFNGMQIEDMQIFEFEATNPIGSYDIADFVIYLPVYFIGTYTDDADKRKLKKQRLKLDCSNLETKNLKTDYATSDREQAVFVKIAVRATVDKRNGYYVLANKYPKNPRLRTGKKLIHMPAYMLNEQEFATIIDAALARIYNNNILFDDIVRKFKRF